MLVFAALCVAVAAPAFDYDAQARTFRDDLAAFVKADTTNPPGNEARIVKLVAERLTREKIPFTITEFAPGRQNIVARLKGQGAAKPLLMLAHIDVVGTADQAWSTLPHEVTERDGFLYGRGVADDLSSAALNLETFIALKNVHLKRDVILALTGDEESRGAGVAYLMEHDPSMSQVGLVLNEGGGLVAAQAGAGAHYATVEVAQKTYKDFTLTVSGTTGHSSLPRTDNAIYRMSAALERLGRWQPPARLLPATRAFFKARAALEDPTTAKAMLAIVNAKDKLPPDAVAVLERNLLFRSLLRTTCVATMIEGGTKANALPAKVTANVNCRILPDESEDQVEAKLTSVIDDKSIAISRIPEKGTNTPSPVEGEFFTALTKVMHQVQPNVPIIPTLITGATDARFFRAKSIPSYGFMPMIEVEGDDARCHGIDERIQVASIEPALELNMRLMLELAQAH
jgi:acetylornithine deacetylase/succinyl-diaminopimelate desuccinylase-like protein